MPEIHETTNPKNAAGDWRRRPDSKHPQTQAHTKPSGLMSHTKVHNTIVERQKSRNVLDRLKELVDNGVGETNESARKKNESGGDDEYSFEVIDLTNDQNPDLPAEQERIERMGGYVSPPPEPGR